MSLSLFALWLTLTPLSCLSQTTLSIPSKTSASVSSIESPAVFAIPSSSSTLHLSVVLCTSTQPPPRFFLNNGTNMPPPGTETSGAELVLKGGLAQWTGTGPATLLARAGRGGSGNQTRSFQIGISAEEQIFDVDTRPPHLGDTTANQALIFSPPFQSIPFDEPTYPEYVLPPANITSSNSTQPPPQTLLVFQTANISPALAQVSQSACGITEVPGNLLSSGDHPLNTTTVLRDYTDYRTQWLFEKLTPSTNYTAYVVTNNSVLSGPLFFVTKSSNFSCPLVHSVPFCPSVTYAVPLPQPPTGATSYAVDTVPSNITSPLLSSLSNFTTSLLTFACGRDIYSPIQTCASCQRAYRSWLCAVSFPRCGEPSQPTQPSGNGGVPPPLPPHLSPQNFTELLPCIEMCHEVARACPSFLQWRCPSNKVNAADSYGIGYVDSLDHDQGQGWTGIPQDSYGNVWCNFA
ncbi:stretch-activated Ca2+-permeable channel component-domain-containing protein [Cantharellus anzutake]|uniref:stretch-activated Ca2+-permeable channel component-domain-containing protein n=1 Tax=Cantharellus anzutake TaxID=1750568 RepID=UPI0019077EFD|nr:stretch-activated Ca2+-permeable channel component-domain-containing protein [Cantharellus anzutake]KAF8335333.1 stretch-activated Ca2+-permeable channel component-domain-containing protein [Cantharellus anzutake]